jgi:hypothetical protein
MFSAFAVSSKKLVRVIIFVIILAMFAIAAAAPETVGPIIH